MIDGFAKEHLQQTKELFGCISKIDFEQCDDYFCFKSGGDGDNGEVLMDEIDEYFKTFYKYRWHDLRKDPNDLPEMHYSKQYDRSDSDYLEFMYHEEELPIIGFLRKQNNLVFGCEELWRSESIEKYNVIAWRYIEPFE